ncbi:carboxymuconolactone decarboxylase family protein [Parasphingopyxis algicola]|uniref:carboxymuconolactone decarboxylase family protein n=1 Tax=Parasphingopyxis algicola TaxID=2026624 RepID=UPI0015A27E62|nr:carboxymuconolactone decarboxylase family protein [Parasphingopyxis algicola]QLC26411.1 carboxymuconolactone decarboxylase family protein [Parasphingopyxis algicola]
MTRIPDRDPSELSPAQRRVHDAIQSGERGVVEGPLRIWLESAEFADRAQSLGAFCRYGTVLPPRLSELAIIITGAHWKAGFEWHVHAPIAIESGLPAADVEAIRQGDAPSFEHEDERIVYDFTTELLRARQVSDTNFERARDLLGDQGVVELVGLLGYYGLISMTINAFQIPLPDGNADPFAED